MSFAKQILSVCFVAVLSLSLGVQERVMAIPFTWIAGNGDWQVPAFWAPFNPPTLIGPPGLGDSAAIHGPRQVLLAGNVQGLTGLVLTAEAELSNQNDQLTVVNLGGNAAASVVGIGTTGQNTELFVNPYLPGIPGFIADDLNLVNGGELDLTSGGIVQINNVLDVDDASIITGRGTIVFSDLYNVMGHRINLRGTIRPDSNETIALDAESGTIAILSTANIRVPAGARLDIRGNDADITGGTWTGAGVVNLDADLTTIESPTTVNMPGGTFDLDGDFLLDTVAINAALTLNVSSLDEMGDNIHDTVQINGSAGQLNVQFTDQDKSYVIGHELDLNGPGGGLTGVHLAGADVVFGGTTTVSGSSTSQARVEFAGDMDIAAGGEFNLQGGTFDNPNLVLSSASFSGAGELHVRPGSQLNVQDGSTIGVHLVNRGRFEPGLSTGTVTVGENFTQGDLGVFGFEIAGPPGVAQDLLQVDGFAILDGELAVTMIDGFLPSAGDVYTVLTAAGPIPGTGVVGAFDSLTIETDSIFDVEGILVYNPTNVLLGISDVSMFGDFNNDLGLDCADVDALVAEIASGGMGPEFDLDGDATVDTDDLDLWLAEAGTFNVGGPYLPGDANLDGVVDGLDFLTWNMHKFTATAAWCSGDFNADGFSDGADFIIWNAHKFMSSDVVSVPEPACSSLLWMLMGLLAAAGYRHHADRLPTVKP